MSQQPDTPMSNNEYGAANDGSGDEVMQDDNAQDDEAMQDDDEEDQSSIPESDTTVDDNTSQESESNMGPWHEVDFSWLTATKTIRALQKKQPLPKPQLPSEEARQLAPRKALRDGAWVHFEYIPAWCDPEWDDNKEIDKKKKEWSLRPQTVEARKRPTLRPEDAIRNPTPYALRWGIDPWRADGRSRMSPVSSNTRRVLLPDVQPTAMGPKNYVDSEDLITEAKRYESSGTRAQHGGVPFRSYLEMLRRTGGDSEQSNALLELLRQLHDDQNYQRMNFGAMTTDELIEAGIHSLAEDSCPDSNLKGQLHSLVERHRWLDTVDRGSKPERPKYVYNLLGERGEYKADNDTVWMAMQPALQLVSRVLSGEHPYLHACLSVYNRCLVDDSRDPRSRSEKRKAICPDLFSFWRQTRLDDTLPEVQDLVAASTTTGYDAIQAGLHTLEHRLCLGIGSGFRDFETGKQLKYMNWGSTSLDGDTSTDMRISIWIAAELVWPLLVPIFTTAEKAVCSFMLANVLLHELAHGAHMVAIETAKAPKAMIGENPYLAALDQHCMDKLRVLGERLDEVDDTEPYFENEQRVEVGWAFENQLWGGTVDPIYTGVARQTRGLPLAAALDQWPHHWSLPHRRAEGVLLLTPPLPIDQHRTPLPVSMISRLFADEFWATEYQKYGWPAIKVWPDKPLKSMSLSSKYFRRKDMVRVLGPAAADWIAVAGDKLFDMGLEYLMEFMNQLTREAVGMARTRKRWHYERRLWPERDSCFTEHVQTAQGMAERLLGALDELMPALLDEKLLVGGLVSALEAVHQLAGQELQRLEHSTVEYLRLAPDDRLVLQRKGYCKRLISRATRLYEPSLDTCCADIVQVVQAGLAASGALSDDWAARLAGIEAKLLQLKALFATARLYLREDMIGQTDQKGWRESFVTVASGVFAASDAAKMRNQAIADIVRLPETLKRVIEVWLQLLDHKDAELSAALLGKGRMDQLGRELAANSLKTGDSDSEGDEGGVSTVQQETLDRRWPGGSLFAPSLPQPATPQHHPTRLAPLSMPYTPTTPTTPIRRVQFGTPTTPTRQSSTPPAGHAMIPSSVAGFSRYSTLGPAFPQHASPSPLPTPDPTPKPTGSVQSPFAAASPSLFGTPEPALQYQAFTPYANPFSTTATVNADMEDIAGHPLRQSDRLFGKAAYLQTLHDLGGDAWTASIAAETARTRKARAATRRKAQRGIKVATGADSDSSE